MCAQSSGLKQARLSVGFLRVEPDLSLALLRGRRKEEEEEEAP